MSDSNAILVDGREVETLLVNDRLPADFTDVLGSLILCGFNYRVENFVIEEFVKCVRLIGHKVDELGEQVPRINEVQTVWEFRGGEWQMLAEQTGLRKQLKSGEVKMTPKSVDALCEFVGRHTNEWELLPVDFDEPTPSETVPDYEDEDLDDEPQASDDAETPEVEAPAVAEIESPTPEVEGESADSDSDQTASV